MNLSGRLIDAFLALEETRRFAIAAKRCHVSASAFSQMISRLEDLVGARLFDRDTRNVCLTPEGEVFSLGAHRINAEIETATHEMHDRAERRIGRVAIAAPPSIAAAWLPQLLARYRSDYPGIALQMHDVVSDICLDLIANNQIDFGLNAQRGNELEFEAHLLFDEKLYLVCPSSDDLAALKQVSLKQLRNRNFIHMTRSGSVWQHMQALLKTANTRDSGFEVAHFGTLAGLVVNGFGVSIVPQFALALCRRPGLSVVLVSDKKASRPIYIVKRRQRSLSAAAAELWARAISAGALIKNSPGG